MGRNDRGAWRVVWCTLSLWLGTALQLQREDLGPLGPGAWAAVAALAGLTGLTGLTGLGRLRRTARSVPGARTGRSLLIGLLGCCTGLVVCAFSLAEARAGWRLADALPAGLEGRDLQLTGRIVSLPQPGLTGTRFEFEVDDARDMAVDARLPAAVGAAAQRRPEAGRVEIPRRVSLGWYRSQDAATLLAAPALDLEPGQRWRFTVRLRRPHGSFNPHGFDLELWLFERGLRASGSVRDPVGGPPEIRPVLLSRHEGEAVDRWRLHLRQAIGRQVDDARIAGVLAALVVGDQGAIGRADWALFRDTGVAHLMAISGLHITMFAWLAAAAVGLAWRRSVRLMLAVPAPVAARLGGLVLAAAYALLAGWGLPAQRTLWMLAVVAAAQTLGRRWPGPLVLLAAGTLVVLMDPWALLQPGFWLSFGAVGLLMTGTAAAQPEGDWRARFGATVRDGLRTQAVATVGLAPLTLLFFQQVSLVGFVANLIAIPVVTLLVTPLALAGAVWAPSWTLAATVVQGLVAFLQPLGDGPLWSAAAAPPWAVAAGLLGGTLLVMPLPWRVRWLGCPLALPMLAPLPDRPPPGHLEMVAADVGQGTAVLLRTRHHLLVYDTGPVYSPEADAGERVLVPLLRGRGETRIHRLVLSHRDADHVGGAASLLRAWPVDEVWSSLEPGHPLRAGLPAHTDCRAGQRWAWDGVHFEVLHPVEPPVTVSVPSTGLPTAQPLRPNAWSCVLRITDGAGATVLLTGDIEAAQEAALVARLSAADLASHVLMVPHHGSKTSSSPAFLGAVQPRIAFVQAAYRSRYGHPAPEILARYEVRGITIVRSDECGAWTWNGQGSGRCERQMRRRYWHHRP